MKLRIVLTQQNFFVGDIQGNLDKMINAAKSARDILKADVIVFPELCLTGYPPEDLLLRNAFICEAKEALDEFQSKIKDIYCIVSYPKSTQMGLTNTCSVIYNNTIIGSYAKQCLPNYGVFDEYRYFVPGKSTCVVPIHDIPVGILICEDIWHLQPIRDAKEKGARIIIVPNASPFESDKHEKRVKMLSNRSTRNNLAIVYVNCVGGQDELIFDGDSMVIDTEGVICQHAGFFNENLLPFDIEVNDNNISIQKSQFSVPHEEEMVYEALKLGLKEYLDKNHFKGALIGLSGGIDSALTLCIACDALGKENVHAILMPSRYTADFSNEDAITLANNLGVRYEMISIEPIFNTFLETLKPLFAKKTQGVTEENLQSRIRGMILMAISNKTGYIVLTTGNRSELATGYSTLYGDMAGGFAVLKDIPKTLIYRLAHFRNSIKTVIPNRIITRPPTAELRPDQKDEDTLPPYAILDHILELYLNQELSIEEIIEKGFEETTVKKVIEMIHKNEYKRRQLPVGIRINNKAFGRDRRYPVSSGSKK